MAIVTVKEERAAIIAQLKAAVFDDDRTINDAFAAIYDHEPRDVGKPPALTLQFAGLAKSTPANLRHQTQLRDYLVRIYLSLEDFADAEDQMSDYLPPVWEALVQMLRLGDPGSVILSHVGQAETSYVGERQGGKSYYQARIHIQIEHRTPFNPVIA